MRDKKVLITGGAGFIGSHLVRSLYKQGWSINVLDNCTAGNKICHTILPKINFFNEDIRNSEAVNEAAKDCDAIIHLAALVGVDEVIKRPVETIETEVLGGQNIGKAARLHQIKKIIYASSSAVYKDTIGESSKETDKLHLVNDYAVAKRINELYFQSLSDKEGISTNSLRFFNVYGCGQDERMVIPRFIEQAKNGSPIQVFGDGQQTRDFTHVKDVTVTIAAMLENREIRGIFNVARGIETTILELAQLIKKVTKSTSTIDLLRFPTIRNSFKVDKRVGCPEKLFQFFGIRPYITLEEGMTNYIDALSKQEIMD